MSYGAVEQQHICSLRRCTEAQQTTFDVSLPDLVTVSANGRFVVHALGFSFESASDHPHIRHWYCRVVPDSVPKQLRARFGEFVDWLLPLNIDAAIGLDPQAIHPRSQVPMHSYLLPYVPAPFQGNVLFSLYLTYIPARSAWCLCQMPPSVLNVLPPASLHGGSPEGDSGSRGLCDRWQAYSGSLSRWNDAGYGTR